MKNKNLCTNQSGASLIVSLIMLVVITLLALSAINSSNVNLRIAGNMQSRDEARSAAQQAIEQFISSYSNFLPTPPVGATAFSIDIDKNGTTDYSVSVAKPICRMAKPQVTPSSNCTFGTVSGLICWDSVWDVEATATNSANGVSQTVTQGVNIILDPTVDPSSIGC